jgi:metal-responsive CopG/Arc/MetJ family transcriptional regulator
MKTISIKLPVDLDARLNAAIGRRKTTRSRFLREMIESHLGGKRALEGSALARAGNLVGCLDGGPPDLSTNPKHLKGYGT